jgi:hypothetical protein
LFDSRDCYGFTAYQFVSTSFEVSEPGDNFSIRMIGAKIVHEELNIVIFGSDTIKALTIETKSKWVPGHRFL